MSRSGATVSDARCAVHGHYFERASNDPGKPGLWCYTDRISYRPGETVSFHVCCTAQAFNLEIGRDGALYRRVFRNRALPGHQHETPESCSVDGCGWPVAYALKLPVEWPSGVYRVTLRAETAAGERLVQHHLFIVCPAPEPRAGRLLLVAATSTWIAYNDWGGSNHYEGITGARGDEYAPALSIERPWARGFVCLPRRAPRVRPARAPAPDAEVRYPHMAFAPQRTAKFRSSCCAPAASRRRHRR